MVDTSRTVIRECYPGEFRVRRGIVKHFGGISHARRPSSKLPASFLCLTQSSKQRWPAHGVPERTARQRPLVPQCGLVERELGDGAVARLPRVQQRFFLSARPGR